MLSLRVFLTLTCVAQLHYIINPREICIDTEFVTQSLNMHILYRLPYQGYRVRGVLFPGTGIGSMSHLLV